MIRYKFSYKQPHRHFIDIEMRISEHIESELTLQLPAWRPGRYELGNFAKNIQSLNVLDTKGNPLKFEKVTKDTWRVFTPNVRNVVVKYNYYANVLNAGSTYLDEQQLYVNPVNCCLYVPDRIEESCEVHLNVPDDYEIACSLEKKGRHLRANNFDQLAESPWVASNSLKHKSYQVDAVFFHVWFQGKCVPNWSRILNDFKAFTIQQMEDFGHFPVSEYHFINQILPYKTYHGVEHTASTVISLGPGDELMTDKLYESLLGVSSHELYHTWNVKQIRPKSLFPYDYSKENYSRMGYLYEGVTTYMGDLYLMRSKVFTKTQFLKTQEENLLKHFHNGGRSNMSVADSSFDTWLDGYVQGIPNRKVSIYTEGALCALMIDIFILQKTNGQESLRDVMTSLYENHACKSKGLSEEDLVHELVRFGGDSVLRTIEDHVYGTKDFQKSLDEVFACVGLRIQESENRDFFASQMGLKGVIQRGSFVVKQVVLGGPGDELKIAEGDVILSVEERDVTKEVLSSFKGKKQLRMKLERRFETLNITVDFSSRKYYPMYTIAPVKAPTSQQDFLRDRWIDALK